MALDDLIRYENGESAKRLYQSEEGKKFVPGALDNLMGSLHEDAALSTRVAIKHGGEEDIIELYAGKYQKALGSLDIEELLEKQYEGILNSYLDEIKATKIRKEFAKFSNATVGDIRKEFASSQYILLGEQTESYKFSDKEVENAQKTFKEYEKINNILELLEDIKFENLRPIAAKKTYKQHLEEYAESL